MGWCDWIDGVVAMPIPCDRGGANEGVIILVVIYFLNYGIASLSSSALSLPFIILPVNVTFDTIPGCGFWGVSVARWSVGD